MDTKQVQELIRDDLLTITKYIQDLDTFDPVPDGIGSARHAFEVYDYVHLLDDKLCYLGPIGGYESVRPISQESFILPCGRAIPSPKAIAWLKELYEARQKEIAEMRKLEDQFAEMSEIAIQRQNAERLWRWPV